MKKVIIRQCPVWAGTREHAARVADALRKEPGVDVQLIDGAKGELSVLVDGREVARQGESPPSVDEVVRAVRDAAQPAGA